jgi:hypothetical protein
MSRAQGSMECGYNRGRTLPGMQPRPSFDRALLIPIAVGVVSILGLVWLFSTSALGELFSPPTVEVEATAPPLDVSLLETQIAPPSPPATLTRAETPPAATETNPDADPGPLADTPASTGTLMTESLGTPSATPTPDQIQPLRAGKYDDTDANIDYDRYWTALKNPGTANAYRGTIHMSIGIGNAASFRFTGERFHLGYQRGRNFGTVTVMIDGDAYRFHEQAFDLVWRSPQLDPGEHFVRIIHENGESINLDYIEILE